MGEYDEMIGRALAVRHAPADADREASLLNYAEQARAGDWSMRAALTRFAQPHAERSARVLTSVRRLDAVLHPVRRDLERTTVTCDRRLDLDALRSAAADGEPGDGYPDTRVADLARVARHGASGPSIDFPAVVGAYEAAVDTPLSEVERGSIALLGVALELDALADTLTDWASRGRHDPPADAVDATCALVEARLDELGVPVEQGPPPGMRGGRRRRG